MEYSCISICRTSTCKGPGVTQRVVSNKVSMFFDSAVQNNTQYAQDFFKSLGNIVRPVRQAMRLKCQSMNANFTFDKARRIESVPIELLTLVNFILEGKIFLKSVL